MSLAQRCEDILELIDAAIGEPPETADNDAAQPPPAHDAGIGP
jgi:hypothetical protein